MKSWREDCLARLAPATASSAALLKELAVITAELGFEYCSYVLKAPVPITSPRVTWSSNYPDRWLDHYFSNNYLGIDPLIQRASQEVGSVVWSSDSFQTQPEFWEEASAHGIRYGWAMATRGPHMATGLLSLARSYQPITSSELDETEMKLVWLSHLMQGYISAAESSMFIPESAHQLTDREREVLRWSAVGKTAEEIGKILGITERTVTFHVTSSLYKLDVTNKTQAVAKALLLKLI